jgi:hypothetical protein
MAAWDKHYTEQNAEEFLKSERKRIIQRTAQDYNPQTCIQNRH